MWPKGPYPKGPMARG